MCVIKSLIQFFSLFFFRVQGDCNVLYSTFMWNRKLFRNVLIHEVDKECDRDLEDYVESSFKVTRTRKYKALLTWIERCKYFKRSSALIYVYNKRDSLIKHLNKQIRPVEYTDLWSNQAKELYKWEDCLPNKQTENPRDYIFYQQMVLISAYFKSKTAENIS